MPAHCFLPLKELFCLRSFYQLWFHISRRIDQEEYGRDFTDTAKFAFPFSPAKRFPLPQSSGKYWSELSFYPFCWANQADRAYVRITLWPLKPQRCGELIR